MPQANFASGKLKDKVPKAGSTMVLPDAPDSVVRFGEFELDLRTAELGTDGQKFSLQEKPFLILSLLLERRGKLVTRDELVKRLWPDGTFVDYEQSLNKAMTRLREALDDSAEHPRFIETLPRRGYRFIAPVTSNGSDERGTVSEESLLSARRHDWPAGRGETSPAPTATGLTESSAQVPIARRTWGSTAAVVLALIAIAGLTGYGLHRWTLHTPSSNFERLRLTKITSSGKAVDVAISPDGNHCLLTA